MKPKFPTSPLSILIAMSAVAAFLAPLSASAATFTWDGGAASSQSWGNLDNWDPNGVPTFNNTADISFNNVTRPNNDIGNNRTIRSITYGADMDSAFATNFRDFDFGTGKTLTLEADAGNATITVDAGATGNINLGFGSGTTNVGSLALNDNLDVVHNGTGLLLFNRAISGTGFGITKTGTGTMQLNSFNSYTGAVNINQGTLIANTSGTSGQELSTASAINLGGGTLEIRANFQNKTYATPPLTVSAASTLAYNNVNTSTYTASFTGTGFTLNADLAVKNISTDTTFVNAFNLSRPITGSGKMTVTTYNNIAATSDAFGLGRILLAGDNSAWTGNLTIARGTVSLSGNAVNAAGTGAITIGTDSDTFGAGLTFFPQGPNGSTITYANSITINAGGFRAIKGGGTDHSVKLTGNVALNGDLFVDHTWGATDRRLWLSGNISGNGGLTITKAGGNAGTTASLSGTNTYLGNTVVSTGASLACTASLTSDISVASGARFGGNGGSTTKTLTMASGANFIFYVPTFAPFNVTGSVTLDSSFGVASLVGGSQSEAINWASVADGTYTLIGTTASTFNHITNFGAANAADLGGGRSAYFQNGASGGLQLVVATAGFANWQTANSTAGGLDQDHDGDGVSNGIEYFLFGSGNSTGFTALPGVTGNSVTWVKATTGYTGTYGNGFIVQTSASLASGSWVTALEGTGPDTVTVAGNNVTYNFPTTGPKKFARLVVTGP